MTSIDAAEPERDSPSQPDRAARQAEIVGSGPRIPPLPASGIGAEGEAIVRSLRAAAGLPDTTVIPELVATLLRHPALYARHAAVGAELFGAGALAPRQRELAVLRTAWLCGAPFEWGEHIAIAKRAGLDSVEIERLTRDAATTAWPDEDRAIVEAAEELHRDAMISDPVWEALAAFLDERQLIELVYVIGHYTKVAFLQNALRLRLGEDNRGLAAR